jgi:hypothetical protein
MLSSKNDKIQAQRAAKEVLSVLQSTKNAAPAVLPAMERKPAISLFGKKGPSILSLSLNGRRQRSDYHLATSGTASNLSLGGNDVMDNVRGYPPFPW